MVFRYRAVSIKTEIPLNSMKNCSTKEVLRNRDRQQWFEGRRGLPLDQSRETVERRDRPGGHRSRGHPWTLYSEFGTGPLTDQLPCSY